MVAHDQTIVIRVHELKWGDVFYPVLARYFFKGNFIQRDSWYRGLVPISMHIVNY